MEPARRADVGEAGAQGGGRAEADRPRELRFLRGQPRPGVGGEGVGRLVEGAAVGGGVVGPLVGAQAQVGDDQAAPGLDLGGVEEEGGDPGARVPPERLERGLEPVAAPAVRCARTGLRLPVAGPGPLPGALQVGVAVGEERDGQEALDEVGEQHPGEDGGEEVVLQRSGRAGEQPASRAPPRGAPAVEPPRPGPVGDEAGVDGGAQAAARDAADRKDVAGEAGHPVLDRAQAGGRPVGGADPAALGGGDEDRVGVGVGARRHGGGAVLEPRPEVGGDVGPVFGPPPERDGLGGGRVHRHRPHPVVGGPPGQPVEGDGDQEDDGGERDEAEAVGGVDEAVGAEADPEGARHEQEEGRAEPHEQSRAPVEEAGEQNDEEKGAGTEEQVEEELEADLGQARHGPCEAHGSRLGAAGDEAVAQEDEGEEARPQEQRRDGEPKGAVAPEHPGDDEGERQPQQARQPAAPEGGVLGLDRRRPAEAAASGEEAVVDVERGAGHVPRGEREQAEPGEEEAGAQGVARRRREHVARLRVEEHGREEDDDQDDEPRGADHLPADVGPVQQVGAAAEEGEEAAHRRGP